MGGIPSSRSVGMPFKCRMERWRFLPPIVFCSDHGQSTAGSRMRTLALGYTLQNLEVVNYIGEKVLNKVNSALKKGTIHAVVPSVIQAICVTELLYCSLLIACRTRTVRAPRTCIRVVAGRAECRRPSSLWTQARLSLSIPSLRLPW